MKKKWKQKNTTHYLHNMQHQLKHIVGDNENRLVHKYQAAPMEIPEYGKIDVQESILIQDQMAKLGYTNLT
jgi:hypothetical protein